MVRFKNFVLHYMRYIVLNKKNTLNLLVKVFCYLCYL